MNFRKGATVEWKWLGRPIRGKVKDIYFEPVTRLIKTKNIKRNGSKQNPAYLVESDAGNLALKLHTELSAVQKTTTKKMTPTMFGDD